jgi:hypothetical protein
MSIEKYILKTKRDGLKILTINDLEAKQFTIQKLLNFEDDILRNEIVEITSSQIIFAEIQNVCQADCEWKGSLKLIKVPI